MEKMDWDIIAAKLNPKALSVDDVDMPSSRKGIRNDESEEDNAMDSEEDNDKDSEE
ncbi:hypothetical protein F442_08324 [Phytophthora nicotianae P10297]|uniref:Uncharacterized protein n=1 Tax=Phytophthora nicotianae P10297 TaxID=1317064 RepID=W2ZE38_PHYNI|nr:hypothetical protein F442_08324 [Phytophthora nicotianae P10297]